MWKVVEVTWRPVYGPEQRGGMAQRVTAIVSI